MGGPGAERHAGRSRTPGAGAVETVRGGRPSAACSAEPADVVGEGPWDVADPGPVAGGDGSQVRSHHPETDRTDAPPERPGVGTVGTPRCRRARCHVRRGRRRRTDRDTHGVRETVVRGRSPPARPRDRRRHPAAGRDDRTTPGIGIGGTVPGRRCGRASAGRQTGKQSVAEDHPGCAAARWALSLRELCTAVRVAIHHLRPRSWGGSDDISNLAAVASVHHPMLIPNGPYALVGNPNQPDGLHLVHTDELTREQATQVGIPQRRAGPNAA